MSETGGPRDLPEIAYYFPEPYWRTPEVDALKTLLLFFDEIAILLPRYMRGREVAADPVLAAPLREMGLLRILEPETFIDQRATEELSEALVEVMTSGGFDQLEKDVPFAILSRSRLGWNVDASLGGLVVAELEAKGLALPSEDGVSVRMHPEVRKTILVLLSQLARSCGLRSGLNLQPVSGMRATARALIETLSRSDLPSAGHVLSLDLATVTVDLATVPLEDVLSFRAEQGEPYRAYARELRSLIRELGPLTEADRREILLDRQEAMAEHAASLRRTARRTWTLPLATFSLGAVGAAWAAGQQDFVTAALALAGGTLGVLRGRQTTVSAYSYLFEIQRSFA